MAETQEEKLLGKQLAKDAKEKRDKQIVDDKAKELADKKASEVKVKADLKNVAGEDVSEKDYFFSSKGEDSAPNYFNKVCGYAVDREDMLTIFNKIFKPADGFLFYKVRDKEVYVIIVPLKYSSIVGADHESQEGDFQKHAISFISEGSVNLDTLRMKLLKVSNTIKIVA